MQDSSRCDPFPDQWRIQPAGIPPVFPVDPALDNRNQLIHQVARNALSSGSDLFCEKFPVLVVFVEFMVCYRVPLHIPEVPEFYPHVPGNIFPVLEEPVPVLDAFRLQVGLELFCQGAAPGE